jgi:signal transduction histidine kinase
MAQTIDKGLFKDERSPKLRRKSIIFQTFIALVISLGISQVSFDRLESLTYDWRMRLSPNPPTSKKIGLVVLGKEALIDNQDRLDIRQVNRSLEILLQKKPMALALIMDPRKLLGKQADRARFAELAAQFPNFYVAKDAGLEQQPTFSPPLEKLQVVSAPKTFDKMILAKDGITRRQIISYRDLPILHPIMASVASGGDHWAKDFRGAFELLDAQQAMTFFHPSGTFPVVGFSDLLNGKFQSSDIENKIVFLGKDIDDTFDDYISTPLNSELTFMNLAEMHANMTETLISNTAIRKAKSWVSPLLASLLALTTVFIVIAAPPVLGLWALLAVSLGFLLASYLSFWIFAFWLPMIHPLLAMFLSYYVFIPYRLVVENRRNWEFRQRNQLLRQVEELKTNFISMMSHDLKTPIARIQGMLGIIEAQVPKKDMRVSEAIEVIKSSSNELLQFISSILNYALIESKGVELNLSPKDVNQLVEEVILRHDFLAKLKGIHIEKNLEPLFSTRIDSHLMRQVVSNLLDNAIKYSPNGSRIVVSTREVDGKIEIQIKDSGLGIPQEELPNVFMKFFRSKNAKISTVKGSGLGLYLAKYFVDLHRGDIKVESELGKGSVFKVELPL